MVVAAGRRDRGLLRLRRQRGVRGELRQRALHSFLEAIRRSFAAFPVRGPEQ